MRARCPSCDRRFTGDVANCPFDETPLVRLVDSDGADADGDPDIGTLIANQYRLLEIVGEGGMGVIYRARQETVGRDVAVKLLRAKFAKDDSVVQRFENEARIISQLRHPNTLRLYDTQRMENGSLLIVTEFLEGQSLDALLRAGPLGVERALSIAEQVCASLSEAHAVGVVHRDLKPANVFLDRVGGEDYVKVLDFGIAKLTQGAIVKTQANIIMGTPAYMAPEQVRGEAADARADIYALGVLLYQMLTGHPPFSAENTVTLLMKQVHEEPPPISDPAVPLELDRLVFELLAKDPATRPQSVSDVRDRLRAFSRSQLDSENPQGVVDFIPLDRPIQRARDEEPTLPAIKRLATAHETSSASFDIEPTKRAQAHRRPAPRPAASLGSPIELDEPLGQHATSNLELFLDESIPSQDLIARTRTRTRAQWTPILIGVVAAIILAGLALRSVYAPVGASAPLPSQDPVDERHADTEFKSEAEKEGSSGPTGVGEKAAGSNGTAGDHGEPRERLGDREARAAESRAEGKIRLPAASETSDNRPASAAEAKNIDPLEAATKKLLGTAATDADGEPKGSAEATRRADAETPSGKGNGPLNDESSAPQPEQIPRSGERPSGTERPSVEPHDAPSGAERAAPDSAE